MQAIGSCIAVADDPAVEVVSAGLEMLTAESYRSGAFQFQSSVRRGDAKNPERNRQHFRGVFKWKHGVERIEYQYWSADGVRLDISEAIPNSAGLAIHTENEQRALHWYKDKMTLIIAEKAANRRKPHGIDIGPKGLWFTLDGQVPIQHLLTKEQQNGNARWLIDSDRDQISLGVGKANKSRYYRFDFLTNDYVLPIKYANTGDTPALHFAAELEWNLDGTYPSPARAEYFRFNNSEASGETPWIAFICEPIQPVAESPQELMLSVSDVPDGTRVIHYRREGSKPNDYIKGGKDATEAAELRLRQIADELRNSRDGG